MPSGLPARRESVPTDTYSGDTTTTEIIKTLPPTEPTITFKDFLTRFHARVVDVPPNGHCFYGALYAGTIGTCECERLDYDGNIKDEIQQLKKRVLFVAKYITLMESRMGADRLIPMRMNYVRMKAGTILTALACTWPRSIDITRIKLPYRSLPMWVVTNGLVNPN